VTSQATEDPDQLAVEARRAEVDALTRRLEDERLVSGWVWPQLTETMAVFAAWGDRLLWVQASYLRCVIALGDAMFIGQHENGSLLATELWPRVPCVCGRPLPGVRPTRIGNREVVCVRCPDCERDVAMLDGEPYDGWTLRVRQWG
jgi:hypothetical protein